MYDAYFEACRKLNEYKHTNNVGSIVLCFGRHGSIGDLPDTPDNRKWIKENFQVDVIIDNCWIISPHGEQNNE